MTKAVHAFAFMALTSIAGGCFRLSADTEKVPAQLQPPASQALLLLVHGKGDQIYSCKSDVAGYLWELKAPDAQLFDEEGKPFGRHFAGPSWEAKDGSRVTGTIVDGVLSSDANSIPWLLLTVKSRAGDGVLARVTSIQRLHTKGGKAPASCDAAHVGQELRVPYSADYFFSSPNRMITDARLSWLIDWTSPNGKKLEAIPTNRKACMST